MRELIAILRGIKPEEVVEHTEAIIETGITKIEVPMNSPDPFHSIEKLVTHFKKDALIGGGTVLKVEEVKKLADIGANLVISPNCNSDVIKTAMLHNMQSYPGVVTPSECILALESGAYGLKFFPAFLIGTKGFTAISAVLPSATKTYAVGGVGSENFSDWIKVGITGFGIASSLYKAGQNVQETRQKAKTLVDAYDCYKCAAN